MTKELSYRCKSCQNTVVISTKVLEYMTEKGESLPERCDKCRKGRQKDKREIRINYFRQLPSRQIMIPSLYCRSNYTSHGDRSYIEIPESKEESGLRVRMTDDHIEELYEKLEKNQVVVLASPTGTGKSVYVLYRLLDPPPQYQGSFVDDLLHQGQVVQTQPLSAAVEKIPETVSEKELKQSAVRPMGILGLRHRGREDYDRHNLGVVVTDGSLRNWLRDGHIGQYSLIMVDEAHQRSLNIDSLLALLQFKLPLHPHLKVIISSATINIGEFKEAFESKGISTDVLDLSQALEDDADYTVHFWQDGSKKDCDCWLCRKEKVRKNFWQTMSSPPEEGQLPQVVASYVIEILRNTKTGSILVFLPGEAVIEKSRELIEEKIFDVQGGKDIPVLPIYSRLGDEVSNRFNKKGKVRRVLLTTDIAETSHTLDDVVYLVESGFIKQSQWDPESLTSSLPNIRHSQAGCKQRFGRVGRNRKGYVYCLYTQEQFNNFQEQTTPEVFRSQTDEVLVNIKSAGVSDNFSFIGEADNDQTFDYEIKRSLSFLSEEKYLDEEGNVTEDGLESFRIPLTIQKKALLDMADQQGCLEEMLVLVSALETDRGEARTGAESSNPMHGILVWDPRWTAETKMRVSRVLDALKLGCRDDLEFILKIVYCFQQARMEERDRDWATKNFVNYSVLEEILDNYQKVREMFLAKAETRSPRELELSRVSKLRLVLSRVLKGREVKIKQGEKGLFYQLKNNEEVTGYISEACAGNWQDGDEAILLAATKKKGLVDGEERMVSVACALAKPDIGLEFKSDLFWDQNIPVGTRMLIHRQGNKEYVAKILQAPTQLRVEYGEELDFAMLMDNYLRRDYVPQINYNNDEVVNGFNNIKNRIEVEWKDKRRDKKALLRSWKREKNGVRALVEPFEIREAMRDIISSEQIRMKVKRVFQFYEDARGWVLVETEEGLEFPLEISELSLSYFGNALQFLEQSWITLPVVDKTLEGRPIFSRLSILLDDLEEIKWEAERYGKKEMVGYVEKVDRDRNQVIVYTPRNSEIIHFFSIFSKSIPQELTVGSEVPIIVSLRENGQCYMFRKLKTYERSSLPRGRNWEYNEEMECLYLPFFLNMEELETWEASDRDKEKLVRHSWNHAFKVDFDYDRVRKSLSEGERVEVEVDKVMTYRQSGNISGLSVKLYRDNIKLNGFIPSKELVLKKKSGVEVSDLPCSGSFLEATIIKLDLNKRKIILSEKRSKGNNDEE